MSIKKRYTAEEKTKIAMKSNIFPIKYNIIQAPMAGGIVNPNLVAQVCNNGMLGFIPAGYLDVAALEDFIIKAKSSLNQNSIFGVNLFLESNRDREQIFNKSTTLINIEQQLGLKEANSFKVPPTISESGYVDLLIKHNVPIVSCTFGFFNHDSVAKLQQNNIKIIGNATNLEEFKFCLANGADAVVLQGVEAGGHQASFLSNDMNDKTSLDLLKSARALYKDAIIISAGGISPNNLYKYFQAGTNYVQLGSAFMLTSQSNLSEFAKKYIVNHKNFTSLTKAITGKWARGVTNKLMAQLENETQYPFPIQHYATSRLRLESKKQQNPEYMSLWVGSNPDNLDIVDLSDLISRLITALEEVKI